MLNPAQKRAVETIQGPLLINAGAGSGKTFTITERVASLVFDHHVDPRAILCVTFTNKAAKEMRTRIAKKLGVSDGGTNPFRTPSLPMIGTFHAIASFFLRMFIDRLGYDKDFIIYDSDDILQVVKECMKELSIDPKETSPRSIQGAISRAKNGGLSAEMFSLTVGSFFDSLVLDTYRLYEKKLRQANALDFDDLLLLFRATLDHADVRDYFHARFQYFLVDEYQDTNTLQYEIIKILASKTRNLCVVGDDWQGIYSWRGADINNILSFQKDYPEAVVINLEENYRSTQSIIQAANSVIQNNLNQMKKHLFTSNPVGDMILLLEGLDEKHEASVIADQIYERSNDDVSPTRYSDWAILYRTNGQSRLLEEALIRKQIPYRIYGGVKFYDRKEIKDILAYFRILYNPNDLISLRRIINVPGRKIGDVTVEKFFSLLEREKYTIANMCDNMEFLAELPSGARNSIAGFIQIYTTLHDALSRIGVSDIMQKIIDITQYEAYLKEEYTEAEFTAKMENLKEFMNMASYYDGMVYPENIASFLEDIALITDQDREGTDTNMVSLMTIHLAKGLEFPNVVIAGTEEGIFPHSRTILDSNALEEERRLMYVAMTRAKETLVITRAHERYTFGNYSANPQSRFIKEIPEEYCKREESRRNLWGTSSPSSLDFSSPVVLKKGLDISPSLAKKKNEKETFSLGMRIKHPQYGVGTIVSLSDAVAEIAFSGMGVKKMNVEIAPIEKIS